LTAAEYEARTVANLFGAVPLVGTAATKKAVVAAMPRSRLIHLASHGLLDSGEAEIPGALVLASPHGDGLLTAREIARLPLHTDLVVLSACSSGGGRITGDGVIGLARSFLAAGAKGVVVSLWEVDDEATAFLMTEFYGHLKRAGNRAGALREAMLATRDRYPDPGMWAGFIFIGIEPGI
jgi:CHAT domain-containing protein